MSALLIDYEDHSIQIKQRVQTEVAGPAFFMHYLITV